jgi:hypothetical protein
MERLNLLLQQERSARTVYEGRPLEFFARNVSLPPRPDKPPKKQPKPPRRAHNRISDERALEIWHAHEQGLTNNQIRRATGIADATVARVLSEPRPSLRPPAAPVSDASAGHLLQLHTDMRSPAPAGEREPQRLGVLEWAARLGRIEFSAPDQHKPKKGRSRGKGFTHHQVQQLLRSNHSPSIGMSINTKPRAIVQSIATLFA